MPPSNQSSSPSQKKHPSLTMRWVLFSIGWLSLILGVIGIFLPVLPTTPFLLLSAACFVRSSSRFYQWLVEHPRLGQYIIGYLDGSGIPRKAKRYTLLVMWGSISLSMYLVPLFWVQVSLPVIALLVSIYLWRLPEPEIAE